VGGNCDTGSVTLNLIVSVTHLFVLSQRRKSKDCKGVHLEQQNWLVGATFPRCDRASPKDEDEGETTRNDQPRAVARPPAAATRRARCSRRSNSWFTEGFSTADLKEAKALLEKLRGAPSWANRNRDTIHQWPTPGPRSGGGLRAGVVPQALPLAGCQLQDQPRRMRRDALDDIAQIHERIDLQVLAGWTSEHRMAVRCAAASLPANNQFCGPARSVGAPAPPPLLSMLSRPSPVAQRVADGCTQRALR
jgi:hypothetical protein